MIKIIKPILRFMKQEVVLYTYYYVKNEIIRLRTDSITMKSVSDTIKYVAEKRCSVSRFGDGEFLWIIGAKQNSFQENSNEMQKRLADIIVSDSDNHIVCLPDSFASLGQYNKFAKRFWSEFMVHNRQRWITLLNINKTYYNTNMTRLYMDFKEKNMCKNWFLQIKQIWENRDIVIIEGEKTRLGVGNDLFENARSIRRILAPAVNAFSKYKNILERSKKLEKDVLILIALGPTATILAYDLSLNGLQAVDIGHIDIEYEWMKMGAKSKVPIANKYVNEAAQLGGTQIEELHDYKYQKEIIDSIL